MKKAVNVFLLIQLISMHGFAAAPAATMPLADFIHQVQVDNGAYVTSAKKGKALELRGDEWKMYSRPNLIGGAEHSKDKRLTNAPAFQGSQTTQKSYFLGLHQTTDFGLDATLTYRYTDVDIAGVDPGLFKTPQFVVASPILELNQSLWRNFLGSQVQAKREGDAAQVKADKLNEDYNLLKLASDAENAYWHLVVVRKLVTAVQGNMTRAERIQSWFSKRSEMQLSDQSDSLQGNAIVATRRMELQAALDDERAAARAFNTMRGIDAEEVKENLEELSYETILKLTPPARVNARVDVQAAEALARADRARAKFAAEAAKPDVSAYATLSLNGRNAQSRTSVDQSFSNDYPYTVVGVKLNVPLSFGVASDTRQGYNMQAESSEIGYKRKVFEAERLWLDLTRRFEDGKKRLGFALELEKAQQKKVDFERQRRGRGRSTTYQVIQFEQDYASAQVNRINLEAEILTLYSQLKTFGGAQ